MSYSIIKQNQQITSIRLIKDGKTYFIPFDNQNTDYKKYLEWVEEGNVAEEIDLDAPSEIQIKINKGRNARECCEEILDLIAGYNIDSSLSENDVDSLQLNFSEIDSALRSYRPSKAKRLIAQVNADGQLVTQDMLDSINGIFDSYDNALIDSVSGHSVSGV